jgi:hypothetical protein
LAELVTKTNNVPSLQLKAQGKSTIVSQIDFVIPQTADHTIPKPNVYKTVDDAVEAVYNTKKWEGTKPELKTILQSNEQKLNDQTVDAVIKSGKWNGTRPELTAKLPQLKLGDLALQPGCDPTKTPETFLKYQWFKLWLDDALRRYTCRIYKADSPFLEPTCIPHTDDPFWYSAGNPKHLPFYQLVCQPKLTISTQFQLLFDASAGANILNVSPIILPISGLNIDGSPDYTHFLQVAFTLKPDEATKRLATR